MIIHLVGAQETNYPWGFENRVISAIRELGHTLISTDFRKERHRLPKLLQQRADLILVCKGEGIEANLIESCPCITALWYAEQVGTSERFDKTALARRQELAFNVHAFDYVFSHDPANLSVYRSLGAKEVFPLPCAAVDQAINRKIDTPKKYDVVFVGSKTVRRSDLLSLLRSNGIDVFSSNIWDADECNKLFNESRIVLNLHLSDLLNTETRVAEVLGAGSLLLTETLSDQNIAEKGKHYVEFSPGNMLECADKISYYLEKSDESENIANCGCHHIHAKHDYKTRIQEIINTIDFFKTRRIWPSYALGLPIGDRNQPTLRIDRYVDAVRNKWEAITRAAQAITYSPSGFKASGTTEYSRVDSVKEQVSESSFLNTAKKIERYKNSGWGLSRMAFEKLYTIIEKGQSSFRIIEFGSGVSSQFFIDCALEMIQKEIQIVSFDNDPEHMFKENVRHGFFRLLIRKLVECDDAVYEKMFERKRYLREEMKQKISLLSTRQKNNFYDVNSQDIEGVYDLMVLDGPNGNGRSIAFLHMIDHLKAGSVVFIDDFTHYDFVDRFKSIYCAEEVFRNEGGIRNKWETGGDFIIFRLSGPQRCIREDNVA